MRNKVIFLFLIFNTLQAIGMQKIDEIPLEIKKDLLFIKVKINQSEEDFNFMFDSGAGVTAIDEGIVDDLNLKISGNTKISTASRKISSKTSFGNKLYLGENIRLKDIPFYLMDLSHLSKYLKIKVDGIIGWDLLKEFIIETNLDSKEFYFYSFKNFQYSGNAKPIKLIPLESNHFGIPITIKTEKKSSGISMIFKIDTGADNHLTVHNNAVVKYNLIDSTKKYKSREGFSVSSEKTSNLKSTIFSASIPSKKWRRIPVIYEIDPLNNISERKGDGLIGQAMLMDFNITYDMSKEYLYLEER